MHRSGLSFAFQPQLLFTVLALFAILPVTPVVSSRPMFKKGCSVLKFKPTTAASLQSAISMMRALVLGALPTPRYAMYQTGCLVSLNPVMCLYPQPVLWSELALGGALCCVFLIDRDNISLTKSCEYFGNHKWKHLQREYLSLELSGIYDCYNYKIIFISKRTSISMFSTEYYGCIWSFCKWFYKLHEQKKVSGRGLEGRVCRCDIFLAFMYLISMYVMNNKFSHEIDVSKCMRLFLSIATCIVNNI